MKIKIRWFVQFGKIWGSAQCPISQAILDVSRRKAFVPRDSETLKKAGVRIDENEMPKPVKRLRKGNKHAN